MPKLSAKAKIAKRKKKKKTDPKEPKNKNQSKAKNTNQDDEEEKKFEVEQIEEEQDLEHLLKPMQAHDLKNNTWCIDDKSGYPGQVASLKMSKTGKHGHAKFTYKLIMPHTGKTSNPMHPGNDQLKKPVMTKEEYIFIKFIDDQEKMVQCKDNKTGKMFNIEISPQAKNYEKVINSINKKKNGEIVILTILKGPKYSTKKIEMVECVVAAKIINEA